MHEQHKPARPSRARYPEPVRAYAAMNTVRALEHLAFAALSTAELAASLQVSVRTARRLLQRLALEGFVIQEGGHRGRYHATLRRAALGRQMLNHAAVVRAAAPRVARLAHETSCVAHFWIAGYEEQVVCAVHADGRTRSPAVSLLCEVAAAPSSAAGAVLLRDRAELRSCCYMHLSGEPTFAAAALQRGHVIGSLGITGEKALDATAAVITAAAGLSADLEARP
jgi:DNA-binding IclR family transcriptional regulator